MAAGNISSEMQLSLNDLAMELKSLGLKPSFNNCSNTTELSDCLLNTSWALINLVHCGALGFNESKYSSDREALLLSEKESLESKLGHLRSQIDAKERLLSKEEVNSLRMETEQKKLRDTIEKQKNQIAELSARLATQERDFKHESRKQDLHLEALREKVRKSIGVGTHRYHHAVCVERLNSGLGFQEMQERSSNHTGVEQSTVNRLKAVNCILVDENLMLRDALKSFHGDISLILNLTDFLPTGPWKTQETFTDHIFQLPLAYSMKKLSTMRQEQVKKLHDIVKRETCSNCIKAAHD